MNRTQIRELTDKIYPEVVRIRRHFHENAEVSEHEEETCQYILDYLNAEGIECRRIAGNGVVAAVYGNGQSQKTIGIRADIDALPITEKTGLPFASKRPGVMHACGHDMHAAILLGSAIALNQVKEQLPGNVKFFFQPAEETIGGAEQMIKEGCLENPKVDMSLALHMDEKYPVGQFSFRYGPMYASTTEFAIHVKGTSCHGAHPDMGADAIIMAGNLVSAFQTIISRNMDPTDPLVITIGTIHGGTSVNTIAQNAAMLFEFRSDEAEALEIMEETFRSVIKHHLDQGICVSVKLLGDRPCSGNVDERHEQTLIDRAAKVISDHYGYSVRFCSGSTDCNIPLSIGVPAVCVGCVEGEGAHTREEYVTISSLKPGLGVALQLILHHFH